jgi:hypothetical protein
MLLKISFIFSRADAPCRWIQKLYKEDREKIAGALMAFGGFHDHALRKSTTHLITLEASGVSVLSYSSPGADLSPEKV